MIFNLFTKKRFVIFISILCFAFALPALGQQKNNEKKDPIVQAKEDLAYTIGVQAFIYGYPTVELYRTFYEQVIDPNRGHSIGVNEFNHIRKLATPQDTWVVTPNNDTYYSRAWVDLSEEPLIMHIPPIKDRFFAFPIGDFYHDAVASLGWWNVGENGGDFALVQAGWQGVLPDGVEKVEIGTPMCWILARTLTSGTPEDSKKVHALQDQYSLTRLSSWKQNKKSKMKFSREYTIWNPEDPLNFFVILNEALRLNPPRPADEGLVAMFKEIGLHPTQKFDSNSIDDITSKALLRAIKDAKGIMALKGRSIAKMINGWLYLPGPKEFGTDYLFRAALESFALLHGEASMTVGYIGNFDSQGKPLNGNSNYEIKFDVPPPVLGFWSLTMYDGKTKLLVDNPIDRYSIGDRTSGIKYAEDGSLTIHLSNQSPNDDKVSNWLPTPDGPFYLVIRAYNASPGIFNGGWSPPSIQKQK